MSPVSASSNLVYMSDLDSKVYFRDYTALPVGEWYDWKSDPCWIVLLSTTRVRVERAEISQSPHLGAGTSAVKVFHGAEATTHVYVGRDLIESVYRNVRTAPMGVLPYELALQSAAQARNMQNAMIIEKIGLVFCISWVVSGIVVYSRKVIYPTDDYAARAGMDIERSFANYRTLRKGRYPDVVATNIQSVADGVTKQLTSAGRKIDIRLQEFGFLQGVDSFPAEVVFESEAYTAARRVMRAEKQRKLTVMASVCVAGLFIALFMAARGRHDAVSADMSTLQASIDETQRQIKALAALPAVRQAELVRIAPEVDFAALYQFVDALTTLAPEARVVRYGASVQADGVHLQVYFAQGPGVIGMLRAAASGIPPSRFRNVQVMEQGGSAIVETTMPAS